MTIRRAPDLSKVYGVLGLGRFGSSLAYSFQHQGAQVRPKTRDGDFHAWLQKVDVICLCLRDSELEPFVVTHRDFDFSGKVVLQHSGVTPLDVLAPLAEKGATIGKWHPLQAFTNQRAELVPAETHWAFEGDVETLVAPWTEAWRGMLHHLEGQDWQVYHLAAVLSANYLPLLIRMGSNILEPLAADRQEALDWLKPLIEQSVVAALDGKNALPFSGPAIRGDRETLERHTAWLEANRPEFKATFERVSHEVMDLGKKAKLS